MKKKIFRFNPEKIMLELTSNDKFFKSAEIEIEGDNALLRIYLDDADEQHVIEIEGKLEVVKG